MQKLTSIVILALSLISASCAVKNYDNLKNGPMSVLERAKKLESAINSSDPNTIWEMSTPWFKRDNPKNEYVNEISKFLSTVKFKSEKTNLIAQGDKYAITEVQETVAYSEYGKVETIRLCGRTMWLKFANNWYWHEMSRTCDFMPNADEIEYLTRNIP